MVDDRPVIPRTNIFGVRMHVTHMGEVVAILIKARVTGVPGTLLFCAA